MICCNPSCWRIMILSMSLNAAVCCAAAVCSPCAEVQDPVRSPAFFWMWNDRLELPRLYAQLEDMRRHGIRNVCVHPFPKDFRPDSCPSRLEPDYLSEGFLSVFSNVVCRAAALGMHAYLYDEGGWPSGGACGQVARSDVQGRFRKREIDAEGRVTTIGYPPGSPYPSILEKGEVERFIELTHEKYARFIGGEFGRSVRVVFTDEPNRYVGRPGKTLGWTADFADEFMKRKGYDIVPFVGDLIRRGSETDDELAGKRIDYCEVAADLFVERYLQPIRTWCRRHGLLSGGHFNGEDNLRMTQYGGCGNILRSLRMLDVPGVDVIFKQIAPQPFATHREVSLPFPRYASSAAHQIGGKYALSESFGIFGDSLDPFELKWNVDFQLVRGINTFVFGYYNYSDYGPWMALFEPHFGPASPCWDFMPHLFGYVTRCCETLSRGRPGAECAVLYDVRGLWAGGADTEAASRAHEAVAAALDDMQVDYDFFDEDILREASVGKGVIRMGEMEYRTLVLPTSKWLSKASRAKLEEFRAAGGTVADFNTLSKVPRTLLIRGGTAGMRVMKRIDGGTSIYFLVNANRGEVSSELVFPEGGRVIRFEADTGRSFIASRDGCVRMSFASGESAIFFAGKTSDAARFVKADEPAAKLVDGWTARRVMEYAAGRDDFEHGPVEDVFRPIALGDWRGSFGDTFSGRVVYRVEFSAKEAGPAEIDLGEVRYCAGVTLNGRDLGKRFFGPYRWRGFVGKGVNRLEVEVANLLVNQTGNAAIRARINRDHPPRSSYDAWQRPLDQLNHDSGLYGPVTVAPVDYPESLPKACPKQAQIGRGWTGDGFWDRRHADILSRIADGPKEYDCVFIGDSITHNWTGWSDAEDLAAASNAYRIGRVKFAPSPGLPVWREMEKKYRLLNLGLAGDDTANVLWRLKNGGLDGYTAKNFVVMIGTNNPDSSHPDGVAAGVHAIVNEIAQRHPESRIILHPIFPRGHLPDSSERLSREHTNRMIRSFADGKRIVWLDFNDRFLASGGKLPSAVFPDYLHPLEDGYRIWREALEPLLSTDE